MKDEEVTMHYKTFDTHKYIKSLQESGFNEKQAEMLVKSLLESRDFDLSILATREQVSKIESNLEKQISATREQVSKIESNLEKKIDNVETKIKELSNTISSNKYDIIKWMVTLFVTMIIAIYLKR
ncbi:CCDC90 family protein [Candidatus Bandiella numerosa]|uniref:CCDC90 family protein n=1 Tax=Candidatus Bandiella numerosa TaxID=2570586 RepID=UPI001F33A79D|nr:CCDC90 family protein [Candidatus Bandiella numerosa]